MIENSKDSLTPPPSAASEAAKPNSDARVVKGYLQTLSKLFVKELAGNPGDALADFAALVRATAHFGARPPRPSTDPALSGKKEKRSKPNKPFDVQFVTLFVKKESALSPRAGFELCLSLARLNQLSRGATSGMISRDRNLESGFREILFKALEYFDQALVDGRATELAALGRFLETEFPDAHQKMIESIRGIPASYLGRYPADSRSFVRSCFGDAPDEEEQRASFADESQQIDTSQLGFALKKAWLAKNSSPSASEAFEKIAQYAETFHSLSLYGKEGETLKFDPAYFAADGAQAGDSVKVIAPGVQWSKGSRHRVIVPGIAVRA